MIEKLENGVTVDFPTSPKSVAYDAVNAFTVRRQLIQLIKELNELAVEVGCLERGDDNIRKTISEVADVKFMLLQLELILDEMTDGGFKELFEVEYDYKIKRTKLLINNHLKKKAKE